MASSSRAAFRPPPLWSKRVLVPRIRAETFDARTTRCILYLTYSVLAVAIALTVVLRLGYDRAAVTLSGVGCTLNATAPSATVTASCATADPTDGANSTAWTAVLSGLSAFDGNLVVTWLPGPPTATTLAPPLSGIVPLSFDVTLDGYRAVGSAGGSPWVPLASIVNATATLACGPAPAVTSAAVWTAQQLGLPRLGGALQSFARPSPSTLQGVVTGSAGGASCGDVTVFDSSWVSFGQGSGGGYSTYRIAVTYHGANVSALVEPTPGTGAAVGTPAYSISYQTAAFRASDVALRIVFIVGSLVVIERWCRSMLWQKVWMRADADGEESDGPSAGGRRKGPSPTKPLVTGTTSSEISVGGQRYVMRRVFVPIARWMPQQWWVLALLVTTCLWQDPFYVATQLLTGGNEASAVTATRSSIAVLPLVSAVTEFVGWAALFTFWWLLVDGMKVPGDVVEALARHHARLALAFADSGSGGAFTPSTSALTPGMSTTTPPTGRPGGGALRASPSLGGGAFPASADAPSSATAPATAAATVTVGDYAVPASLVSRHKRGGTITATPGASVGDTPMALTADALAALPSPQLRGGGSGGDEARLRLAAFVARASPPRARDCSAFCLYADDEEEAVAARMAAASEAGGRSVESVAYAALDAAPCCRICCIPCCCSRRFARRSCCLCRRCGCCGWSVVPFDRSSPLYGVRAYPTRGCAFYGPKLLFFVTLAAVGSMLQVLSQPDVLFGGRDNAHNPLADPTTARQLLLAVVGLGALYVSLLIFWLSALLWASVTTGKQLERLPYTQTRFQQLAYRLFFFQQGFIVVFVIAVNLIPLGVFLRSFVQHPVVAPSTAAEFAVSIEAQVQAVIRLFTQAVTPIGELLLVSIYVYLLAYCYAPPLHPQLPGFVGRSPWEVALAARARPLSGGLTSPRSPGSEGSPRPLSITIARGGSMGTLDTAGSTASQLEPARQSSLSQLGTAVAMAPGNASDAAGRVSRRVQAAVDTALLGVTDTDSHRFSLQTCSWLYDMACAAYFDPPGLTTVSSYGPITAPPHGFVTEGVVYDAASDTFAWVLRRHHRVILAFRGTGSRQNVNTDLRFVRDVVQFDNEASTAAQVPGVRLVLPLVHRGFWAAYSAIRVQLTGIVQSALVAAGSKARMYCTGHSLGGALATLAAYDLRKYVERTRQAMVSTLGTRGFDVAAVDSKRVRPASWHPSTASSATSAVGGGPGSAFPVRASPAASVGAGIKPAGSGVDGGAGRPSLSAVAGGGGGGAGAGAGAGPVIATVGSGAGAWERVWRRGGYSSVEAKAEREERERERAGSTSRRGGGRGDRSGVRIGSMGLAEDGTEDDDPATRDAARGHRYAYMSRPRLGSSGGGGGGRGGLAAIDESSESSSSGGGGGAIAAFAGAGDRGGWSSGGGSRATGGGGTMSLRIGSSSSSLLSPSSDAREPLVPRGAGASAGTAAGAGAGGGSAIMLPRMTGVSSEASTISHMLLDDDVLEGADPLDCVGVPPDEDPVADLEFLPPDLVASQLSGGGVAGDGLDVASMSSTLRTRLLLNTPENDVVVYTFGSPRVGNYAFARMYNKAIPFTFRCVYDGDVIAAVPKLLYLYKHVGVEVWLDAYGNVVIDPSFVEQTFRTKTRTSLAAHRMSSYRRALIHARRNEGLLQFRQWLAEVLAANESLGDDGAAGAADGGVGAWA